MGWTYSSDTGDSKHIQNSGNMSFIQLRKLLKDTIKEQYIHEIDCEDIK